MVSKIMRSIPIKTLKNNIGQTYQQFKDYYGGDWKNDYTQECLKHFEASIDDLEQLKDEDDRNQLDDNKKNTDKYKKRLKFLELNLESGFYIFILMNWFLDHQSYLSAEDD